jgi:uncharacterized membrane protein
MWQKLSKCYPPHLELIPLFLLAFTIYLSLSNYATLPDTIPTHFNAQGIADGWGGKNTIFIFLGLNAFLYILFTAINIAFAVVRDPRSMINLPAARKAALSDTQIETLRVTLNRYLFLMKLLTQGLTVYLLYITIEVAWERASSLGALFSLFILGILAVAGLMVWQALRLTRTPKQTEY